jgi:PilZ domain-containing protein
MHKHHSHARSTPVTAALVRNGIIKRRSTRMGLNASIALTGHDRHKTSFNINAKAINLNMHGAAVQLHRELSVGSTIRLQNKRGIQVSARVVSQISAVEGLRTYGIEFLEQDDRTMQFWGISFPTA